MDNIVLNAKDICSIIKECKGVGISELKFSGLCIKFNSQGHAESTQSQGVAEHFTEKYIESLPSPEAGDAMEMFDEQASEDALYAQMLIEDPAEYEKLQMLDGIEAQRTANA